MILQGILLGISDLCRLLFRKRRKHGYRHSSAQLVKRQKKPVIPTKAKPHGGIFALIITDSVTECVDFSTRYARSK